MFLKKIDTTKPEKMSFWRKSEKSDARRDAQPHLLLVKNTFWAIFYHFVAFLIFFSFFAILVTVSPKNTSKCDFLIFFAKNTPKYYFIRNFWESTSKNTILLDFLEKYIPKCDFIKN